MTRHQWHVAIQQRTAVLFAGMALLVGLPLLAQGAEDEVLQLEKFQVTGSRISRTDTEGLVPLALFDRADIERSGAMTLNEFFRDMVYSPTGVIDETFTQGFAPGTSSIDLRSLGVNRTLVLLDGRRLPIYPFGQGDVGQGGTQSFVDINSIPLAAIERIEVLKDGASAIYGADAVAGVVNLITRKDVDGTEATLGLGMTGEADGEEGQVSAVVGKQWDQTSATFVVDYFNRQAVMSKDRDISRSANGPIDDRSMLGNPGTWIPLSSFLPQADTNCPEERIVTNGPASFCSYDFAPWTTLIPETQRLGLLGNLDHRMDDGLRLFARAMYSYTYAERDLAPTNNAPDLFFVSDTNPTNPLGENMVVLYRLEELGPRRDEFETNAYNLLAGIGGFAGSWDWEAAIGYGLVDAKTRGVNGYATASDLQTAVNDGTLNLFGPSPAFDANGVMYTTRRDGESKQYYADVKATRDIYELSAGAVQMALGAEIRREEFHDEFDERTLNGEILGIGGVSGEGDRDMQSAFVEFSVPATDKLELQLAGRYDHYSDFGSTFNPKLGLRWQPRYDFLVRASAGTGFKAPALHELYSGEIEGVDSVLDDGTLVNNVTIYTSGNPDLDAEDSQSLNLGFVWDITRQWDLAIDGWYLKNEHAVTDSPQYILDNEARFRELVVRDEAGNLVSITSPFQNIAAQKLWGIDLDTHVDWATENAGKFDFGILVGYLGAFEKETVEGEGFEDVAGEDGRPRVRGQGNIGWKKSVYAASLTINYIGGYDRPDVEDPAFDSIDSWTTLDAQFGWSPELFRGGKLTLGINNLLDKEVPEDPYLEGWPFYNRALHDARGRFFYARYQHKF